MPSYWQSIDYGVVSIGDGWLEPGETLRYLCYKKWGLRPPPPPPGPAALRPGLPGSMPYVLKMALLWVSLDGKLKCKSVFWLVPVAVSMFSSCQQQLTGQAHPCTAIVTAHWQTSDPAGPDNGKLLIFVGSTNLQWTTNVMSSIVSDSDNPGEKSFRDCLYFLNIVFQNLTEYMYEKAHFFGVFFKWTLLVHQGFNTKPCILNKVGVSIAY